MKKILTPICPTCSCSLIRLGIGSERWTKLICEAKNIFFVARVVLIYFIKNPQDISKKPKTWLFVQPVWQKSRCNRLYVWKLQDGKCFFVDVPIVLMRFKRNPIIMSNVYRENPKKVNETL